MQKDIEAIWTAALNELALQMTKATFETWMKPTWVIRWEGDNLVVGVANEFTKDWLENRLLSAIERTLVGIVDQPVRVKFLVTERRGAIEGRVPKAEGLKPGKVAFKFYRFDPRDKGWLKIAKYHIFFWQPFLGRAAWAVYLFLRSKEKLNEGWGAWNVVSVDLIRVTAGFGRQAITGVQRWTGRKKGLGKVYWQKGAFDRLEDAGLAQVERLGKGKNISYRISILHELPILTPQQVETLPELVQIAHAQWLRECAIEYDEWEQLGLPTLVHGED